MINEDCFDRLPKIKEKIDLVLCDLPFNQTALKWDKNPFDLNKMWIELKKICKRDCIYVFFCTTKFGYKLIQSNERWFRYDLVWEKSRKVGFLSANKMPLRKHEMIYVFKDKQGLYNPQKTEGKPYKMQEGNITDGHVYDKIKRRSIDNKGDRHPTSILQFDSLDLVEPNNDSHEMVYVFKDKQGTYNPQKTEGKPYKHSGVRSSNALYGGGLECSNQEKTDRHPTTILKFNNPKKSLHRTAKPVDLCEWLIKTYSNEGENVLDFTMGSGSTGIACLNTNRNFIGIEKDETIFKLARHRLFKHELCQILKNDQ